MVAEHHHLLPRVAVAAGFEHAEAGAVAQEQVDDGQVPQRRVAREPARALGLRFGLADRIDARHLAQRARQAGALGGVVFDDEGADGGHGGLCKGTSAGYKLRPPQVEGVTPHRA
ncbi:hypothetical protein D9M68_898480 [compost metagenome]